MKKKTLLRNILIGVGSIFWFSIFVGIVTNGDKTTQTSSTPTETKAVQESTESKEEKEEISELDKVLEEKYKYKFADIENGTHTEKIGEQLIIYEPISNQTPEFFKQVREDALTKLKPNGEREATHNGEKVLTCIILDTSNNKGTNVDLFGFTFTTNYDFVQDTNSRA